MGQTTSGEPTEAEILDQMNALLDARAADKTICPSEVARALRPDGDWRALMEPVREVARGEADAGRLEVRQGGEKIDPHDTHGPIRLARPPA